MREAPDILTEARRCLETAISAPYPEGFSVNRWWSTLQRRNLDAIRGFETPEQAVLYACGSGAVPFDHRRRGKRAVIEFKLGELERLYPGFSFGEHPSLRESPYCDQTTLEDFGGVPYSNIFLWHVNFYLSSTSKFRSVGTVKNVVEIGSGYGALARVFKTMNPEVCYTLVDLPESLFFAHIFLALNFPNARIHYLDDENHIPPGERPDFFLVPVQMSHLLDGQSFDIAINIGSLQEMTAAAVAFWMNWIEHRVQVKGFYSCNYFLKVPWGETRSDDPNLMCPVLDPFWRVRSFSINPEIITLVDISARNWLELCVERIPAQERDPAILQEDASTLLAQAKLHPRVSDEWFANLWMAIWRSPSRESISEMLDGIHLCRRGLGARNFVQPPTMFDHLHRRDLSQSRWSALMNVFRANTGHRQVLRNLVRGRRLTERPDYEEEKFYKRMLSQL